MSKQATSNDTLATTRTWSSMHEDGHIVLEHQEGENASYRVERISLSIDYGDERHDL